MRRGERERRALCDRVKDLERALQACEMDKKHIQVHTHLCFCLCVCKHNLLFIYSSVRHPTVDTDLPGPPYGNSQHRSSLLNQKLSGNVTTTDATYTHNVTPLAVSHIGSSHVFLCQHASK